jgi:UDP-glucose 4-epimerase
MKSPTSILVTGGAGFIGSNLVDRLVEKGHSVRVFDNLSTGRRDFLESALGNSRVELREGDLLNLDALKSATQGVEFVYHLAANADVRHGTEATRRDLEQNTIATYNVLEAMRVNGVKKIAFSSTGSIYGESKVIPTPEDAPFPVQTSLYGASKLAGEGLISSFCEGFGFQAWIFRFVSILGERYTHGHIFDFYKALKKDPSRLYILGNGKQKKSYLYVGDCVDAIETAVARAQEKVNIFNLGTDEFVEVNDSAALICETLGLKPKFEWAGGERGWIGDNPYIYLDTKKIRSLGWKPRFSIREGVVKTVNYLRENPQVFARG